MAESGTRKLPRDAYIGAKYTRGILRLSMCSPNDFLCGTSVYEMICVNSYIAGGSIAMHMTPTSLQLQYYVKHVILCHLQRVAKLTSAEWIKHMYMVRAEIAQN